MSACSNRWVFLFLITIPLIGYSQKPRFIQQKVDYKDSPIIKEAKDFKSYAIRVETKDTFAEKYFKQPQNVGELKFSSLNFESSPEQSDVMIILNIGDLKVLKKDVKKTIKEGDESQTRLFSYQITYTYPITYKLTDPSGKSFFQREYFQKGQYKTNTFSSQDKLIENYKSTQSRHKNSMRKKAITATLKQFNIDKEYLVSGRQISDEFYIYYLKSSKKLDFSAYEEQAKNAAEALNNLNSNSSIPELSAALQGPLKFWKEKASGADPDDKNDDWVIPACYYNLGICNYYLNDLDEAAKYVSEVDISKKINLYLAQYLLDTLEGKILHKKVLYDATGTIESVPVVTMEEEVKEEIITKPLADSYYANGLDNARNQISDFKLIEAETSAEDVMKKSEPFETTAQFYLEASLLLANIYQKQGQLSKSAAMLKQALTIGSKTGMSDYVHFNTLIKLIRLEINLSRYEQALTHMDEAGAFPKNETQDRQNQLDLCLGLYADKIGFYHEALDYYTGSLNRAKRKPIKDDGQLIELFELIGNTYYELGNYKKAKSNYLKAYSLKKKNSGENNAYVADSYVLLANTYDKIALDLRSKLRQKDFTAIEEDSIALDYLDKAKSMRFELFERKDPTLLNSEFYLPDFFDLRIQSMKLKYSYSFASLTSSKALQRKLDNNIAESIAYYDSLISYTKKLFGPNHPSLAYYHNELAEVDALFYYETTSEWKKAGRGVLGKMERFGNLFAEGKDKRSNMEIRVDNFYAQEKYREEALKNLASSLEILQICYGNYHTDVAKQHLQIAEFYQEVITLYYDFVSFFNQKLISAEETIDDYEIEDADDRENYDALTIQYNNLLGYFRSAYRELLVFDDIRLNHYKRAYLSVIADTTKEEVIIRNVLRYVKTMDISQYITSPETFRHILYKKSHYKKPIYEDLSIDVMYDVYTWNTAEWEDKTKYGTERRHDLLLINREFDHVDKLEKNLGSIADYDQLIDIMIQSYVNEDDQFALAHRTKYHRLIAVDQILGNRRRYTARTSEMKLDQLDQAYYYIEKTKALVLMSSMAESEAILNTYIPKDQILKEQELQAKIRETSRKVTTTNSEESKQELRQLKSELKELKDYFAKTYPRYNKSRYNLNIAKLSEIQSTLDDYSAIISYSTSPENMIIFTVTSSKVQYKVINLTSDEIMKQVKGFRNSILYRSDEAYIENGRELFDKLIPKLNKDIDKLIIIPDGELATIPFEALLTAKVPKSEQGNYPDYPFLIKDYQINYAFSGTLYLENLRGEKKFTSNKLLGFAPVFSDGSNVGMVRSTTLDAIMTTDENDTTRTRGVLRNGKYINPIPSTEEEVNNLYDMFNEMKLGAKVFTHEKASESTLKTEDLNQYRYIHFATHGLVNEKNPELSGLLFAQLQDDIEDGMLYAGEIYNLEINADLVSLSACETGLGKVVTGEGVVGLSRAFTYAGTRNLLVSYWKVSDASTSLLMQDFYQNVLKDPDNITYGNALQAAKINMIGNSSYAHPYYWSPFVIIGN